MSVFGQQGIHEHPQEYILQHGIKRIVLFPNSFYQQENSNNLVDTSAMFQFNERGLEVYSVNYQNNQRHIWTQNAYDSLDRILSQQLFNTQGYVYRCDFSYLPNGDYTVNYSPVQNANETSYSKFFFDEHGNEILREDWNWENQLMQKEVKTYNASNRIIRHVYQHGQGNITSYNRYVYKRDTILKRQDCYFSDKLEIRTKYYYFPDGKLKESRRRKQSSSYSIYDDNKRLSQILHVQYGTKDTIYTDYRYNEKGLIHSAINYRQDNLQSREVYTYENGKERTKTTYQIGNLVDRFSETVYYGDTARVIYSTPFWEKRANHANYQQLDSHGNVLWQVYVFVKGTKQPLHRWMKDLTPFYYHFEYSESGKVLAKYQIIDGWEGELQRCRNYSDSTVMKSLNRANLSVEYPSCHVIETLPHLDGKHYVVSFNSTPNLMRHIYENKSGAVDSILDVNNAGTVLNRMIQEKGKKVTYFLLDRYEYNELDSLESVFNRLEGDNYARDEDMIEAHFWENGRKMKTEQFKGYLGQYSPTEQKTITFDYRGNDVMKTTKDAQGKAVEELMTYDENGRLIQIMKIQSNAAFQTNFRYDTDGNLLERTEVLLKSPTGTSFVYEF